MRTCRGFSLLELVVILGAVGVLAAIAVPAMIAAADRNKIIAGADLVAAQIREARLAAVTKNTPHRVRFDCPAPGAVRMLVVTGDAAVDNANDRCTTPQPGDGPAAYLPAGVAFGGGTPPTIHVDGRGQVSTVGGGAMPLNLLVSYGDANRALTITAAGRVATPTD
jgi:Tfp pilus assembly protein FimT